jgi:isoamylase
VKLVAEPWDVGTGGYQVGQFPSQWSEWNDRYRTALRRFWAGEGNLMGEISTRMTASSDMFNHDGRSPRGTINHVTVHDGFTLADLYAYNSKHNEANGEDNRDGSDHNFSFNCGHEGPTDDPQIVALRRQLRKNQLACLLLAHGVPLLLAGDEIGNSQSGNNNAYCQDNEIGWVKWAQLGVDGEDLIDFVGRLTELRKRFPQLTPRHWVRGKQADGSFGVVWLRPDAQEMTEADWNFPEGRFLAYVLAPVQHGRLALFIVLNAAPEAIEFALPQLDQFKSWTLVLHTGCDHAGSPVFPSGAKTTVPSRSVLAFEGSP